MMDGIRKSGRWIVATFLLFLLALIVVGSGSTALVLLGAVAQGDIGSALILLLALAVVGGLLLLIVRILREAPAEADALEKVRRANPDGDKGDFPNIPKRDPWLG